MSSLCFQAKDLTMIYLIKDQYHKLQYNKIKETFVKIELLHSMIIKEF